MLIFAMNVVYAKNKAYKKKDSEQKKWSLFRPCKHLVNQQANSSKYDVQNAKMNKSFLGKLQLKSTVLCVKSHLQNQQAVKPILKQEFWKFSNNYAP